MIDVEHPVFGLIKGVALMIGASPPEGESWYTMTVELADTYGPVESVDEARAIARIAAEMTLVLGGVHEMGSSRNPQDLLIGWAMGITGQLIRTARFVEEYEV